MYIVINMSGDGRVLNLHSSDPNANLKVCNCNLSHGLPSGPQSPTTTLNVKDSEIKGKNDSPKFNDEVDKIKPDEISDIKINDLNKLKPDEISDIKIKQPTKSSLNSKKVLKRFGLILLMCFPIILGYLYFPVPSVLNIIESPKLQNPEQDSCQKFNSLNQTSERVKFLIDDYHWNLNERGVGVSVLSIESLRNCTNFITISLDGIRVWDLYSNTPFHLKEQGITLYSISKSKDFIVYWRSPTLFKFHIPTRKLQGLIDLKINPCNLIQISNNEKYIVTGYDKSSEAIVFFSNNATIAIKLSGIVPNIKKIEVDGIYDDIIISDSSCVKIYFIHSNTPAYTIKTLDEFNSLEKKYKKLPEFKSEVLESKCFKNNL
jgi:hypothetical protein